MAQKLVADCNTCQGFTRDEGQESNWTMSQKCGHIHYQRCTELYLVTRDCPFPPGPSDLDIIDRNPSMKGCNTCQPQPHNPQAKNLLMYEVSPSTHPPEYIDLGQNTPGSLPRLWPDRVLTLGQLVGAPPSPTPRRRRYSSNNGARKRREVNSRGMGTGANAQPIGRRRIRQEQGERHQERQERSRSSRKSRSS